jgi:hypothetical protein
VAWLKEPDVSVIITGTPQSTVDSLMPMAEKLLLEFPSSLRYDAIVSMSAHRFAIDEIEKCLERSREDRLGEKAVEAIARLTFFVPEGGRKDPYNLIPNFLAQFPRWWSQHKGDSQDQWYRDRITREVGRLVSMELKDFPLAQEHLTLMLNALTATMLPPGILDSQEDLTQLQRHWSRFWKKNVGLPRDQWIREVIDIWIEHVRLLIDRGAHPSELGSDANYLHHLASETGTLPENIREHPRINALNPAPVSVQKIREYTERLESWWKTRRSDATSIKDHFRPLFEEGGNPRYRIE